MPLYKIKDFASEYPSYFDNNDIIGYDLYSENEKVGSVEDLLVDEDGQFRYFVINTGVWILGKKVLLPVGRARIEYSDNRVYATHLSKDQVEALPEFSNDMTADFDYEEKVRTVYRSSKTSGNAPAGFGVGYGGADSAPMSYNAAPTVDTSQGYAGYDSGTYTYNQDPDLYDLDDPQQADLKRYQEKLRANKVRQKM